MGDATDATAVDTIGPLFEFIGTPTEVGSNRRWRAQVMPQLVTRGPWDRSTQHGGPVCGLLAYAVERVAPADLVLTRLTVDLLSAVPLTELRLEVESVRHGKRVSVVDARLWSDDRRVARASSQWVRPGASSAGSPDDPRPPVGPADLTPFDPAAGGSISSSIGYPRPGFNCDAVETRLVSGSTEEPGPGFAWFRLRSPVVGGERSSPLARMGAVSDLAAAIGWQFSPSGSAFINPDLTLQLACYPRGEWIGLDSRVRAVPASTGYCDTIVWDETGRIGRITQSLLDNPAPWA